MGNLSMKVKCLAISMSLAATLPAAFATDSGSAGQAVAASAPQNFRGVYFNPQVARWLGDYPESRTQLRTILQELAEKAGLNFVCIFIPVPSTLSHPPQAPKAGQPLAEWANTTYLDNVAMFVDDCHDAGISVEFDLADNRWIPYSVEPELHKGRPGGTAWPVADDTPWDESATWYSQVIEYIESRASYPESIAMWCMMGHYQLGTAEPDLWGNDECPNRLAYTEKFVKNVWPVFKSAGKRPKAAPIINPIFSNVPYWMAKSPEERLDAATNLKQWLVDDLKLPPDYWVLTTYPFCDPAPDGFHYLRRIVEILGKENAPRIISTDFKAIGIDFSDWIISADGHSSAEILEWQFQKCAEHGFAGWWIWAYQGKTGIREANGEWKQDLVHVVKQQAEGR